MNSSNIVVGPDGTVQIILADGVQKPVPKKRKKTKTRTRTVRDAKPCPRDSPLDTLIRGLAEFHIGPLLDAIKEEGRPEVSPEELLHQHRNEQFALLEAHLLGDQ